jgi:hypothetical protein
VGANEKSCNISRIQPSLKIQFEVLVINDPAQIEMISKYVEDIETNSYVSDCVRKGLIGNIGVQEEQRNHTIPLDALELGQMQLVTATKVVTMDQNTIMTMKAHKALGIATGQKILNSAGLLVFVGPRDYLFGKWCTLHSCSEDAISLFLRTIFLAILCFAVSQTATKTLNLDVTAALADCPSGFNKYCNFSNPNYWIPREAPGKPNSCNRVDFR